MADKTESQSVIEAEEKAQKALFDLITDAAAHMRGNGHGLSNQSAVLKNLAQSFRLAAGGEQADVIEGSK
ncbi:MULTISPECIES: hypothetical protein [unclassified Microbacterium]|uniref:hypothetical protein n=1 Tax=unclassified Microbacterium TaxID=2609290 RepID=UPI000EA97062|nr:MULTISPECIES: hypothetical protein [unclassified Microbacterium]MBT2485726.1 hypothetical protein [Microbacterium sp. ISL-108]RKN68494.1 hypothetical protein D7252_13485 [Microbacterium sp. CGR2]